MTVRISVVVPTRDRPERLARCLAALARLDDPPGGFEVVVVADGTQPAARAVVEAAGPRLAVRIVDQAHAGPAVARNTGVAAARGQLIAFTDDDCEPRPDWLLALGAALAGQPGGLAGGPVVNALVDNPHAAAAQLVVDVVHRHLVDHGRQAAFLTTNNLMVARSTFDAVGGFDPRFPVAAAEDRDLCDRARAAGYPLVLLADGVVEHRHDLRLASLWRQQWTYGRGAAVLRRARAARGARPLTVDGGFYVALARAGAAPGPDRLRRAALVGLTQVAYAGGLARELLRPG